MDVKQIVWEPLIIKPMTCSLDTNSGYRADLSRWHLKRKLTFLLPASPFWQKVAPRQPVQDPHQPVGCPAEPQPALPPKHLALLFLHRRRLRRHGRHAALPLACLLHVDGAGSRAHVPGTDQGLQCIHFVVHAQVLRCWMGWGSESAVMDPL